MMRLLLDTIGESADIRLKEREVKLKEKAVALEENQDTQPDNNQIVFVFKRED